MRSMVVMTYYQLMHSIALALTMEDKPNLYFSMAYLDPEEALLERIRETGVFHSVVGITRRRELTPFIAELRLTKDLDEEGVESIGDSLFEKYLEPHYAELFKDADPREPIYIYNDFQWHYYYISKHFPNIIGVEDGYGSLQQQISVHTFKGDIALVVPFIEKGLYPEPLYRHPNVKKIISSRDFENIDPYYRSRLEILDYNDLVEQNREAFKSALFHIFEMGIVSDKEHSSLYLSQPLDRALYCNSLQLYLLNKKYLRGEIQKGYKVYYKPHPAEYVDPCIYRDDRVTVLPGAFPMELFNYQDDKFARITSFGSTGAGTASCAEESIRFFPKTDTSSEEISRFIRKEIKNERLTIDWFIRTREMTPDYYINIYSTIFRYKNIHTNIHIVFTGDTEEYRTYYDPENLTLRIREFQQERFNTKESDLWYSELEELPSWIENFGPRIDFCKVTELDDFTVFQEAVRNYHDYDYMMLLESDTNAFRLTMRIRRALRTHMRPAIFFKNHTFCKHSDGSIRKLSLHPGYVGTDYNGTLSNKLLHVTLMRELSEGEVSEFRFAEITNRNKQFIGRRRDSSLVVHSDQYTGISGGKTYYLEKIRECLKRYYGEPDILAGTIANIVYEYYCWQKVTEHETGGIIASPIIEETSKLINKPELELLVYKKLTNGLLFEKAMADRDRFYRNEDFFDYFRVATEEAAEKGVLKAIDKKLHGQSKAPKKQEKNIIEKGGHEMRTIVTDKDKADDSREYSGKSFWSAIKRRMKLPK